MKSDDGENWPHSIRDVTGFFFFWGGKVIFPDFFPGVNSFLPVENFHFGTPKSNFRRFEKWKAKKLFWNSFLIPFSIFHLPLYILPSFLLHFPPFAFFLADFFPIGQQKFPGQKSLGGTMPPCPSPPPPVTPLQSMIPFCKRAFLQCPPFIPSWFDNLLTNDPISNGFAMNTLKITKM